MHSAVVDSTLTFRPAWEADADAIATLVNSAYRGDSSRLGWTTEADLLDGTRTDREEVAGLIAAPGSQILLGFHGADCVGCVHLERTGEAAYFGMFTIRPGLQGAGLGKAFMAEAERHARHGWSVRRMRMSVISVREELIAFYERRGYRRTGERLPFPDAPQNGRPRRPLELVVLEKSLESLND